MFKPKRIIQLMPYVRIGGQNAFAPPFLTLVQTDGSFSHKRGGRVATEMTTPCKSATFRNLWEIQEAQCSTETEWASVFHGLQFALENNQEHIGLENDNLSVVSGLLECNVLKREYARYYKNMIQTLASQTAWTGIRWIPRQLNKADDVLR